MAEVLGDFVTALDLPLSIIIGNLVGSFAAMWRSFFDKRHDFRRDAQAMRVPTLIIWGTKDIVLVEKAHLVQKSIVGSQLELSEAGHVVFSTKPIEILDVMNIFLE
jgi:pimeloyl-ACP methyl ester carboxylesterase